MIKDLISPGLLRNVRSEVQEISFTLKETDTYRVHQTGDLANLDGLEESSLKLLPSLLVLRNALYSLRFRNYLSQITQAGPLSGKKKDMSINLYTPGCHLLCHDDVIGSRRVSYILYLTDPDQPWKKEWGGALRLYPTYPISKNQSNPIAKDHLNPVAADYSNSVVKDHSNPIAENHSNPIVEDPSNTIVEDPSNPIAEDHSNSIAEDHLNPIVEEYSNPIAEDSSNRTAKGPSNPTAEDHSNPTAEDHSNPIVEGRSNSAAQDQSNPIAEDRSDPNIESEPNPIAKDQYLKMPLPDPTVSIPPAFNQLCFFAVQPGESFHDVEEVFSSDDKTEDEARVRFAISGWYHIPQEGEDGYIEGSELENKMVEKSSLMQLQKIDAYDLPSAAKTQPIYVDESFGSSTDQDEKTSLSDPMLSDGDLTFLSKYIQLPYLVPDTLESTATFFTNKYYLTLFDFLSPKFSDSLQDYIVRQESHALPAISTEIESTTPWKVARPPHKHRFLFLQGGGKKNIKEQSPLQDLLENLLPSFSFYKWLQLATGSVISSHNLVARRFRRGKDYTLATRYDEEDPQLEITLAITPTSGWEAKGSTTDQTEDEKHTEKAKVHTGTGQAHTARDEENQVDDGTQTAGDKSHTADEKEDEIDHNQLGDDDVGGYVCYRADDEESKDVGDLASTGDQAKRPKSDPAVYQTANDDDDLTLFHMPVAWNRLDIVLRDSGAMRFVKYVNRKAPGDRWDICGEFSVVLPKNDDDNDEDEKEEEDMTQKSGADGETTPGLIFLDDTDETEMLTASETSDDD